MNLFYESIPLYIHLCCSLHYSPHHVFSLFIYFNSHNNLFSDVPYFIRGFPTVERLKRLIRLRGDHFYIKPVTEKLILLASTVLLILYTAMCIFQFVETYFQPADDEGNLVYRNLSLTDSLYFTVMWVNPNACSILMTTY